MSQITVDARPIDAKVEQLQRDVGNLREAILHLLGVLYGREIGKKDAEIIMNKLEKVKL